VAEKLLARVQRPAQLAPQAEVAAQPEAAPQAPPPAETPPPPPQPAEKKPHPAANGAAILE
jgi:hypothetical protein